MKLHELHSPLKSPTNAQITTYFETAQGSKYLLSAKNESKRWKSLHANTGSADTGAKDWYDHCVFVDDKFKYEANSVMMLINHFKLSEIAVSVKNNKAAIYVRKDGKWALGTWDDAYPKSKKGPVPLAFDFEMQPKNGLSCVEFISGNNHSLVNYHFGSEVSKILPIADADPADIELILGTRK